MKRFFRLAPALLLALGGAAHATSPAPHGAAPKHPWRAASLPYIGINELPQQAQLTLRHIKDGGPFPYPKDGSLYRDPQGRLPAKPYGYYREYVVKPPKGQEEQAIRIVAGKIGEYFYTDDNYATFRRIVE